MLITLAIAALAGVFAGQYTSYLKRTKQIITDETGDTYLVRYFIVPRVRGWGRLYLHHFLRGDHDRALHDHPWAFKSLILRIGYWEHADMRLIPDGDTGWEPSDHLGQMRKWYGPGSFLTRGEYWRHRVELPQGKTSWTLFYTSAKKKEWGFFPDDQFCHHTKYDTLTGLCNED